MKVTIKFFTFLREITGIKDLALEVRDDSTVDEVLRSAVQRFDDRFSNYLYNEKGTVHSHLLILVNGISITTMQGFKTQLENGDIIAILPPVGGG